MSNEQYEGASTQHPEWTQQPADPVPPAGAPIPMDDPAHSGPATARLGNVDLNKMRDAGLAKVDAGIAALKQVDTDKAKATASKLAGQAKKQWNTPQGRKMILAGLGALVLVIVLAVVLGRGGVKNTTCKQFGEQDSTEQVFTLQSLIRAHGLDPNSNLMAVSRIGADIDTFCGIDALAAYNGAEHGATQNRDAKIDKFIDWVSYGAEK